MYVYVCMSVYVCMCVYCACVYLCVRVYCACVCVRVHVCICVYLCISIQDKEELVEPQQRMERHVVTYIVGGGRTLLYFLA